MSNETAKRDGKKTREKIYNFIVGYVKDNHYAPTTREIMQGTGIMSSSTVNHHLHILHEKGLIELGGFGFPRAIKVKEEDNRDRAVNLIYDLLNEYDIGLWRDIEYIDLAEWWVNTIDSGILDEDKIKKRLKAFLFEEKSSDA